VPDTTVRLRAKKNGKREERRTRKNNTRVMELPFREFPSTRNNCYLRCSEEMSYLVISDIGWSYRSDKKEKTKKREIKKEQEQEQEQERKTKRNRRKRKRKKGNDNPFSERMLDAMLIISLRERRRSQS